MLKYLEKQLLKSAMYLLKTAVADQPSATGEHPMNIELPAEAAHFVEGLVNPESISPPATPLRKVFVC